MFTLYKQLFICSLFFISIISAMDESKTNAMPQDIMLATLTNNVEIFEENQTLIRKMSDFLVSICSPNTTGAKLSFTLADLLNASEKISLSLAQNQNALAFHKDFLARKAVADEQARLFQADIFKDMQERAEASKRRQEEERRQSVKCIQDTLNAVGTTAVQAIQHAYSDIERINEELPIVQAKLKAAQEDRDNHDQRLPYVLGGIFFLIAASSFYMVKFFAPH